MNPINFSVDGTDALFTVNAASGEVSLQGLLDRETARTHIITIQVSFIIILRSNTVNNISYCKTETQAYLPYTMVCNCIAHATCTALDTSFPQNSCSCKNLSVI